MLTRIMKWIAMAALLVALFWHPFAENRRLLELAVLAGAVAVLVQAVRAGKYVWVGLFVAIACIFNPVRPVAVSPSIFLFLDALTLVLFMVSLRALETQPRMSIASITDRTPGSESL
jgi:hypothetical protein